MAKRNLPFSGTTPMDPGERDRAVKIEQRTKGTDASGFPTETWSTLVAAVWMSKQGLKATERFQAHQMSAPADDRWEMPYRTDMDPELVDVPADRRLVYQGRTYDITGATMIGRRDGIELLTLVKAG